MGEKVTSIGENELKWQIAINKYLFEMKKSSDSGEAEGKLDEALRTMGAEIDPNHSLIVNINSKTLKEEQRNTFTSWGIASISGGFSIPLRIPVHGTTGSHGSGERQKLMESVHTMSVNEDSQGNSVIIINLFGNFTGLYHKLVDALSVEINPNSIKDISIEPNMKWRGFLKDAAQVVVNKYGSKWPDFAKKQVNDLSK